MHQLYSQTKIIATTEDISNAIFAIKQGVDWIGMSFVRKASDIIELKELIKKEKGDACVIAKIEKPEALLEIDQIIDLADGIMVARGDLGVEVPFDEVPIIQKMIVEKCIKKSKPVIIATQMMESMIINFRPTRAEGNDVANAVLDSLRQSSIDEELFDVVSGFEAFAFREVES